MTTTVLDIDHLGMKVAGRILFRNFSLQLEAGQKVILTGRSGCGKSTLLRGLLGFTPVDSGVVRLFGQVLTERNIWDLRGRMAYVAQEPEMADERVADLLERPFGFRCNRALHKNLSRVPQLLDQLLLPTDLPERRVTELSGGEKQRLALVLALLLERELLLLDEPSSALDNEAREALIGLLRKHKDLSVLAISHDREWDGFGEQTIDLSAYQEG